MQFNRKSSTKESRKIFKKFINVVHVAFFYSNMVSERVKPICSLLEYICGKSPCRSLQGFFIF